MSSFTEVYLLLGQDNTRAGVIASASKVEDARTGASAIFATGDCCGAKNAPRNDNLYSYGSFLIVFSLFIAFPLHSMYNLKLM